MPPTFKTKNQFVSDMLTAWAAPLGLSPSLVSGDPLLALVEADAAQDQFLQSLAKAIIVFARASTATGADLDLWMADFGFHRLESANASGQVVFSVLAAKGTSIPVPVGTILQTAGGLIKYRVIADTALPTFNLSQNAYILAPGQLTLTAKVLAVSPGTASNVQAHQLAQFQSSVPSIDGVTNPAPFINGKDLEGDQAFRDRFILWINSLSKATKQALLSAAIGIQANLDVALFENINRLGQVYLGNIVIVVDDGTGQPPPSLLVTVFNVLDEVRAFGISIDVVAPTLVTVTAILNVKLNVEATSSGPILLKIQNAIIEYINNLKIGQSMSVYRMIQIAMDTDTAVIDVQPNSVLLQGEEEGLVATQFQLLRTTSTYVTVGLWV